MMLDYHQGNLSVSAECYLSTAKMGDNVLGSSVRSFVCVLLAEMFDL